MAVVNVARLAAFLNLTPRRVQQLVKEGMPREANGQYDPIKCACFYVRYLQNAIEERSVPSVANESAAERVERMRLLRAHAELKEMELATSRSQLVAVEDVDKMLADFVLTTKSRILAIPPRLAPELVGETSRIMVQAKIQRAIDQTLRVLAQSSRADGTTAQTRSSALKSQ
jgi:phage terminase Nu1 subunit (DNA packaging protein)